MSEDQKQTTIGTGVFKYGEFPDGEFDSEAWDDHIRNAQELYKQKARLKHHQANRVRAWNWFIVLSAIGVFIFLIVLSIKLIVFGIAE
jgi:hypothetical protein